MEQTEDIPIDPRSWKCDLCYADLTDASGTWLFPVYHVDELLAPVLENRNLNKAFCSTACLSKHYS